jgi:hypothetical protein
MSKKKCLGTKKSRGISYIMKILALSHFDKNFQTLKNIVVPHNLEYFSKYKIEFTLFNGGFDDLISDQYAGELRNYWTKLCLAYNCMKTRSDIDWIFVLDGDAIFCDFDIDLRTIIKMSDKHKEFIVCCLDSSSEDSYWNINAGILLFKNTEFMKHVLSQAIAIAKEYQFNISDQVLLQNILRRNMFNIREKTEIFPNRAFNHGDENAFIYHACGISTTNQNLAFATENKEQDLLRVIEIVKEKNENTLRSTL